MSSRSPLPGRSSLSGTRSPVPATSRSPLPPTCSTSRRAQNQWRKVISAVQGCTLHCHQVGHVVKFIRRTSISEASPGTLPNKGKVDPIEMSSQS